MRPMVQGVTHGVRHRFSPFHEFFLITCIAGDVFFIYTMCAHRTPFVMIAGQPDLGNVIKLFVFRNLLRNQVIVVIDDGHFRRKIMV